MSRSLPLVLLVLATACVPAKNAPPLPSPAPSPAVNEETASRSVTPIRLRNGETPSNKTSSATPERLPAAQEPSLAGPPPAPEPRPRVDTPLAPSTYFRDAFRIHREIVEQLRAQAGSPGIIPHYDETWIRNEIKDGKKRTRVRFRHQLPDRSEPKSTEWICVDPPEWKCQGDPQKAAEPPA